MPMLLCKCGKVSNTAGLVQFADDIPGDTPYNAIPQQYFQCIVGINIATGVWEKGCVYDSVSKGQRATADKFLGKKVSPEVLVYVQLFAQQGK